MEFPPSVPVSSHSPEIRPTDYSKLPIGVTVTVNGQLSLRVSPVIRLATSPGSPNRSTLTPCRSGNEEVKEEEEETSTEVRK